MNGTRTSKDGTAAIKKTSSSIHLNDGNDGEKEVHEVNVSDGLLENEEGGNNTDGEHERRIPEMYEAGDAKKNGSNLVQYQEMFDHSNETGSIPPDFFGTKRTGTCKSKGQGQSRGA